MRVLIRACVNPRRSKVGAILYLDMTTHPEFSVELPEEWHEMDPADRPFLPVAPGRASRLASLVWEEEQKDNAKSGDFGAYQFFVKPESSLSFDLIYSPTSIKQHEFELPLFLRYLCSCELLALDRVRCLQWYPRL